VARLSCEKYSTLNAPAFRTIWHSCRRHCHRCDHGDQNVIRLLDHNAVRVLCAGGRGYIMKQEGGERLVLAIRQMLAGEIVVSPKVSAKVLNVFSGLSSDISPVERLTDRELEIFQLIGRGQGNNVISDHLHISSKTVDVHRADIREKLQIATTAELISFAARWIE
jgi:DNA-binding NarL/FixJ family response regulator